MEIDQTILIDYRKLQTNKQSPKKKKDGYMLCDFSFFVRFVNVGNISGVQNHIDVLQKSFILRTKKKGKTNNFSLV